uniref:Uncharacterized protein n=1 Tax=Oryza brachyantha TaxID=4533 RepID=J3N5G8_ORYBR
MCILCAVQRWSRRVATMLPWLVLPLILLWALSQLLPAAYRFEVTSPRLACVSVLLLTLFCRDGKRLAKAGDNGIKAEESRVEKAKRKAEEKRLARLEKEMLEEEERKQREEMAKLVEERRRLRDEKAEAEERSKGATPVGEKDPRKEVERRRQERKRKDEKDKGSSKSNSDCEDIERRVGREGERKRDSDRRNEPEKRDATRVGAEGYKPHNFDANNQASKTVQSKAKYFGRMTGGLLSSSRGFSSGSFFGRSVQASVPQANKVNKPLVTITDQSNVVKRDAQPPATAVPATAAGTTNSWTNAYRPVSPNVQSQPTGLKKSWHQLFSRSASVSPCPEVPASAPENNGQPEPHGAQINNAQIFLSQYPPLDSKPSSSRSMQFPGFPPVNGAPANMPLSHFPAGHMPFYSEAEPTVFEELEQFEDPCYDPDAIALLGPVSESLDNFPLDLDSGFISSDITKETHVKPSPIESPLSRSRTVEENPIGHSTAKGPNASILPEASNEQGTWQMWGTPLVQDSLGLRGPQTEWLLPNTNQFNHGINHLNGRTTNPLGSGLDDNGPWLQKTPFQQLPLDTRSLFLSHDVPEKAIHNDLGFGSPNKSARLHPFGPPGHSWSKEALVLNGTQEASKICSPTAAPVGSGFFSTNPDVQSVWSFNQKETT